MIETLKPGLINFSSHYFDNISRKIICSFWHNNGHVILFICMYCRGMSQAFAVLSRFGLSELLLFNRDKMRENIRRGLWMVYYFQNCPYLRIFVDFLFWISYGNTFPFQAFKIPIFIPSHNFGIYRSPRE